jgi:hypothetical protein
MPLSDDEHELAIYLESIAQTIATGFKSANLTREQRLTVLAILASADFVNEEDDFQSGIDGVAHSVAI